MIRYLLDTNICIAAMRGHAAVVRRMTLESPADCAISTVTLYELHTGAEKCSQPGRELAKIDLLTNTIHRVAFEAAAAKEAARIRALLESQGQPIGPYDILLAGQALASSLVLVTANTREFSRVPGLTVENWES